MSEQTHIYVAGIEKPFILPGNQMMAIREAITFGNAVVFSDEQGKVKKIITPLRIDFVELVDQDE